MNRPSRSWDRTRIFGTEYMEQNKPRLYPGTEKEKLELELDLELETWNLKLELIRTSQEQNT